MINITTETLFQYSSKHVLSLSGNISKTWTNRWW